MPLETIIMSDSNTYDVLVIGAGPAGLSISSRLASNKLKVGFIEKNIPGGKIVEINNIYNFPNYEKINGSELALNLYNEAIKSNALYIYGEVLSINKKLEYQTVYTNDGNVRYAKALVIATGISNKRLNIEGEEEYFNGGVSYCATCDGALTRDKNIAIIGNDHEAIEALKYLNNIANKIYFISDLEIENHNFKNVEIYKNFKCRKISGNSIMVDNIQISSSNETKNLNVSYVFIFNGYEVSTKFLPKEIKTSEGLIIVDDKKQTSLQNVYAIGDIIRTNNRQVINAIKDAEIAAKNILDLFNKTK